MKQSFASILDSIDAQTKKKLGLKLPSWPMDDIIVPAMLSLEQCSSEATAGAKVSILEKTGCNLSECVVADLTGGLGADSAAFAGVFRKVIYNERNPELFEAVKKNFHTMGISNVDFSCVDISEETLEAFMREHHPDWVFMDPARRSGTGRKVFKLEDCSPNVKTLLPTVFEYCSNVMLKLSPMADITALSRNLPGLKEVHVIEHDRECKELVCVLQKGFVEEAEIYAGSLHFKKSELPRPVISLKSPTEGDVIFEPSASLCKAGCWGLICEAYGLEQLASDVHLFTGERGDYPFLRSFTVEAVFPLNKNGIRDLATRYQSAEVSARGLKMDSETLRQKLKIKPSDKYRVFGLGLPKGNLLLFLENNL